ncbi:MAG: UPF0489 family protein [Candidatus Margulisbacteria bacterium]|nr:UPF0489 family protein [Candidatus Margulisiibacteriota bacterium]
MIHSVGRGITHHPIQSWLVRNGHYQHGADGKLYSIYFSRKTPTTDNSGTFNTPLIAGSIADIKAGQHPCISLKSSSNLTRPKSSVNAHYTGLKNCVRIEAPGRPPIYVMDNHQMAYFAWHEAYTMGYIQRGSMLIHIDRHSDEFEPNRWSNAENLHAVADYTRNILWCGNFILPAIAKGLFDRLWTFLAGLEGPYYMTNHGLLSFTTQEARDLYHLGLLFAEQNPSLDIPAERSAFLPHLIRQQSNPKKLTIDIDLDGFVKKTHTGLLPTEEDFAQIVRFLAEICQKAGVVTIATSPGYADQNVAIPLARQLVHAIIS